MPNLQTCLESVQVGTPIGRGPLRLVPLFRTIPQVPAFDYVLGMDALAKGLLRVTEIDKEGSIPELLVASQATCPTLLLEGEELVGAMQDRITDTDVLIGPRSSTRIPVSCCEQGRWSSSQPGMDAGGYAPPAIRSSKTRSVNLSVQSSSIVKADQNIVWKEVDALLKRTNSASNTSAMSACFGKSGDYLQMVLHGCDCPAGAVGVLAVVNGQFAAMDLFDRPTTLNRMWSRLTTAYAADTMGGRGVASTETADIRALMIVEALKRTDCVIRKGVCLGNDWRFETRDLFGAALVVDSTAIHLSAFPRSPGKA